MNPIEQKPIPATPTIVECSICFENAEIRVRTRCNHVFHQTCLDQWLSTPGSNGRCAVCRFVLALPVPGQLFEDLDPPSDSDLEEEVDLQPINNHAIGPLDMELAYCSSRAA